MRWWMLCAVSLPLAVSWTGLAGARWAHAATLPDDAPASELGDKHCTTPWLGSNLCGDAFDVASGATLTMTLVSAKDGGEEKKEEQYKIAVYDNTHAKQQASKEIRWGESFSWKNDTGEQVKVQLKAAGPGIGRDIHIRYTITK
jgi:hypothetical protein